MPLHKVKKYEYDDFKSQSTKEGKLLCYKKNCQERNVMQSVTKEENTDVQSSQPAIKRQELSIYQML